MKEVRVLWIDNGSLGSGTDDVFETIGSNSSRQIRYKREMPKY